MDHDEYVAARLGRLLEHAVELGCPEEDAADEVAWVLEHQRRAIEKADDPDPAVREALARRLAGDPEPGGSRWTWAAATVALVLLAVGVVVWRQQEPARATVPSLFGYDVATATRVLTAAGYDVDTEAAEACEPRGLVLGSDPAPGAEAEVGGSIMLRTAVPADPLCLATYGFRSDSWEFIRFARDGPAPDFATRVTVYVDGEPVVLLSGLAARQRTEWAAPLALIEQAATAPAPTRSAMPRLLVDDGVPPPRLCGVAVPPSYAGRIALRMEIDPSPEGIGSLCPFTVDLYRDAEARIEAVAIYSGVTRDVGAES